MKAPGFSIEQVQYRQKNSASEPEGTLRYAVRRGDQVELIRGPFVVRPRVGVVR